MKGILNKVANIHSASVDEVTTEISRAMMISFNNPDPKVREAWSHIAPDGEIPDVEQFIEYISNYDKKKIS